MDDTIPDGETWAERRRKDGRTFRRHFNLSGGGDGRRWPDLKEAHPSCVLPAHTISNAPWNRFALRVKEIKMRFQLFLLSPSTLSWLRKNLSAIYDTDDRNMGLQLHSCVSRACGRKNFSSLESTLLRAEREPECLLSLTWWCWFPKAAGTCADRNPPGGLVESAGTSACARSQGLLEAHSKTKNI